MNRRTARLVARCCFLAVAVTLVLPLLPWASAAMVVPAVSPLVAICGAIAVRSFGVVTLLGLPVLLIVLFRRRWFCRWACPTGLLCERVGRLRRLGKAPWTRWPPIGQWIAILTLAGACCGYPVLLWTDPMGLFCSFFGLCWQPTDLAGLLAGMGLPVVLIFSLFWPGAWCGRICPLGAVQDVLALPRQVAGRSRRQPSFGSGTALARRSVLAAGLGAAWAVIALRGRAASASTPLHPPGALDEGQMAGVCIRCGNCVRTCPTQILRPDPGEHGIAGFLVPVVHFDERYCKEDCHRCTQVCPSGAIRRLSLEEKRSTPIGLAVADMDTCIINEANCGLCEQVCPYEAVSTRWDEESYLAVIEVATAKCPGCGACQVVCPTEPRKAIVVVPCPQES